MTTPNGIAASMKFQTILSTLSVSILLSFSCALQSQVLSPPAPPAGGSLAPLRSAPSAQAGAIPYPLDLPDIGAIDSTLASFYSGAIGGDTARFELWRHIPLEERRVVGNSIHVSDRVWYFIDAGHWAQCGWDDEEARELTVGFDATFDWTEQWTLHSVTTPRPIGITESRRCKLTTFDFDVTDLLVHEAQTAFDSLAKQIDGQISSRADFSNRATQLFSKMDQPVPLEAGQWLMLHPQFALISTLDLNEPMITVGVLSTPTIVVSAVPPPAGAGGLPKLVLEGKSASWTAIGEILVPFSDIESELTDARTGVPANPFILGRRRLAIEHVHLYAGNSQVVAKIDYVGEALRGEVPKVRGPVSLIKRIYSAIRYSFERRRYRSSGTLYALGTTEYRHSDDRVHVEDWQFDQKTKDLARSTKRTEWLLEPELLETMSRLANTSMKQARSGVSNSIENGGSSPLSPKTHIVTASNTIEFQDLRLTTDGIAATTIVTGTTSLLPN